MTKNDGIAQNLDIICDSSDDEDFFGFDGLPEYKQIYKSQDIHSDEEEFLGFEMVVE